MFSQYLNQTAQFQKRLGENDRAEDTFASEQTVKCRKELVSKYVQRTNGSIFLAASLYITNVATSAGDLLDGRRVEMVEAPSTLGGMIPLYWSYVL